MGEGETKNRGIEGEGEGEREGRSLVRKKERERAESEERSGWGSLYLCFQRPRHSMDCFCIGSPGKNSNRPPSMLEKGRGRGRVG